MYVPLHKQFEGSSGWHDHRSRKEKDQRNGRNVEEIRTIKVRGGHNLNRWDFYRNLPESRQFRPVFLGKIFLLRIKCL